MKTKPKVKTVTKATKPRSAEARRSLERMGRVRTKRYKDRKGEWWSAWHPEHPTKFGVGLNEKDALEDCHKQLRAHPTEKLIDAAP